MSEFDHNQASVLPEAPPEAADLLQLHRPIEDLTNLHEIAGALTDVPMITGEELRSGMIDPGAGEFTVEDATVPMSRIVGIKTFDTWAARGLNGDSVAGNGSSRSSLSVVAESAQLGQRDEYYSSTMPPVLTLFEDAVGEVWAYTSSDGSHRTAGAKARGDTEMRHVIVKAAESLPKINFSVQEKLAEKKLDAQTARGNIAIKVYAQRLAEGSISFDAKIATEKASQVKNIDENGDEWV